MSISSSSIVVLINSLRLGSCCTLLVLYLSILSGFSISGEPGFQEVPDEEIKIHERLNTTFKCFAVGIPTPDINWLFNDSQIIPDGIKHSIGPFGDVNFGSLTITDLEYADAGIYTCVANNTHRTTSVLTTLEVQGIITCQAT